MYVLMPKFEKNIPKLSLAPLVIRSTDDNESFSCKKLIPPSVVPFVQGLVYRRSPHHTHILK